MLVSLMLRKHSSKTNIFKEAKELFYDYEFNRNLNKNPYLLRFTNGVIDFKTNEFRNGYPDDYISKSTNMPYIPYNATQSADISGEIHEFMSQLFPKEELKRYMWDHLSACLIGTNENQTFNIYTGCGRNGKSKMVELMGLCMGEYKATVPLSLVTSKRANIGGTSPEIAQLFGVRYAVMQEPSKEEQINEGAMKELTGGDPIQCRALYKDSITFIPQFKLAVCTNTLFDIKSNDDGTWRRIRVCDFMSTFV
jgi:P4 family phage/plasmid primase-like protien